MAEPMRGPWYYQDISDQNTHIVRSADGWLICELGHKTDPMYEATARLLAAAWDLREACKKALTCASLDSSVRAVIEGALDKAGGPQCLSRI